MANARSFGPKQSAVLYLVVWTASFLLLRRFHGFEAGEAIPALLILGLLLPAISLFATRGVPTLPYGVLRPRLESAILAAYLLVIGVVLVWGFGAVARITAEPLHSWVLLGVKLAVFVLVPGALCLASGYRIRDLAPISLNSSALRPALWLSLAMLLVQSIIGRGPHDIHSAHLPAWVIAVATPLSFVWLMIEVGVVEEFFFRVLLQERLAALLRSAWGGLVLAALLFGLVHAPGFYLRAASTQESLGLHPSLFMAVGYSIVITSLAGLFLGVLWMRTRNFAVIVIVHAASDLLPNLVPWIKAFHLFP